MMLREQTAPKVPKVPGPRYYEGLLVAGLSSVAGSTESLIGQAVDCTRVGPFDNRSYSSKRASSLGDWESGVLLWDWNCEGDLCKARQKAGQSHQLAHGGQTVPWPRSSAIATNAKPPTMKVSTGVHPLAITVPPVDRALSLRERLFTNWGST
jgi:hypothetical protein